MLHTSSQCPELVFRIDYIALLSDTSDSLCLFTLLNTTSIQQVSCFLCINVDATALPYLTFGVGRLLHLPSAEAVSVRPNAQPRCNQRVTVIGCEAKTSAVRPKSAVKPNKSPATWDW